MKTSYDWECYLKQDQRIIRSQVALPLTMTLLLNPNPMRRGLILPLAIGQSANYGISDFEPGTWNLGISAQSFFQIITWDMIGDWVTYAVWGQAVTSQVNVVMTEICVNPTRWSKYQEYLNG